MNQGSSHPSFEKIADYILGALADAETAAHLESCLRCEVEAARLGQLVQIMQNDFSEDAPAYAIARVLHDFDRQRDAVSTKQKSSVGNKIRAVLRLDSANLTPNFGFRSSGSGLTRQLLFYAGDSTLDLRIAPRQTQWEISGQVLGELCGGRVELVGETVDLTTELNPQCEFTLSPISSGTYRLRLYSEDFDIEVPDLTIG
jgi:hypothetical protein